MNKHQRKIFVREFNQLYINKISANLVQGLWANLYQNSIMPKLPHLFNLYKIYLKIFPISFDMYVQ